MAGLVVAFKNYNVVDGIFLSPWVGLKNFEYLLKDAFAITRNTLLYNLVFITLNTILGIIFAIFICDVRNKKLRGRNRLPGIRNRSIGRLSLSSSIAGKEWAMGV